MATSLFRCFGRSENMTRYFEKNCVISGAGMSKMYRKPEVYLFNLAVDACRNAIADRSEEHTSELQSLMRISYAVFCLKKKKNKTCNNNINQIIMMQHDETTRLHYIHIA